MGIPSYFSHIIHHHAKILYSYASIIKNKISFSRLYMDCNSILYDIYHNSDTNMEPALLYDHIIAKTIEKIENYVNQINPSDYVYIAFDGVAPRAKMEQQRTRRYKSWFEASMYKSIDPPKEPINMAKTTCIFTPGTEFMDKLSISIREHFTKPRFQNSRVQYIIATPDEPGEGEHKLYAHLRENPCKDSREVSVIYGLDADLLMLSLLHLQYSPSMYVFREAPQFASLKLDGHYAKDEPLFLNIGKMATSISGAMRCSAQDNHRMVDYVFMCFFLGNDFLPHFPSMNIRTIGIQALMDVYRNTIGSKPGQFLLSKQNHSEIQWNNLSIFLQALAKHEHEWLIQEYTTRKKFDQKPVDLQPKKTVKEKMNLFLNTPVLYRATEKAIDPFTPKWQSRYYKLLFPAKSNILLICRAYLEGLQWVTQYYTVGKVDWKWHYPYAYPPLLEDLAPKVPHYYCEFLPKRTTQPVHPYTQLSYVLPPVYHFLLPDKIANHLRTKYSAYYVGPYNEDQLPTLDFQWAFCRYFWECHVKLPHISEILIQDIDKIAPHIKR